MKNEINIDGRPVGANHPPYVLAEVSANHNGSLERALQTIDAAKASGADGAKIQTYTPDTMTIDCDKEDFQIRGGLWDGYNLYELYRWAQTPFEWHKAMFEHARSIDFTLFSTPFDETAVDLLEDLNTPAYKVASFELIDLPLIRYIAATKKPMIMSTGMANLEEIEEAVTAAREGGCTELIVLHCISAYPAPIEQANLHTIGDLAQRFDVMTGLSDHTLGTLAPVVATTLGACFIEKHFTLSRADKGPDSDFSIEPAELTQLRQDTIAAWESLGKPGYSMKAAEKGNSNFRRSLYFVRDLAPGEVIGPEHVRRIRPGFGLKPKHYDAVIGKSVVDAVTRGTAVQWDLLK